VDDDPYVIEYNVRMGDPETEVVLPRIKTDLLKLLKAAASGRLAEETLEIDPRAATTVMLVSGGYPEDYQKGKVIDGLDNTTGVIIYHAGTTSEGDKIKTSGGRVIAVTAMDADYNEALKRCYHNIERIHFDGMNYRTDIGFDLP